MLIHNRFYLATPDELNDPYDCKMRFSKELLIDIFENKKFLGTTIPEKFFNDYRHKWLFEEDNNGKVDEFGYPERKFKGFEDLNTSSKKAEHILSHPNFEITFINNLIKVLELRLTCFSIDDTDDSIMWSYYTLKHNGVRIKFDFPDDSEIVGYIKKVTYDRPVPIPRVHTLEDVTMGVVNKLKRYDSEQEVRLISTEHKYFPFERSWLKEIYFGRNTAYIDKKTIASLCVQLGYTAEIMWQKLSVSGLVKDVYPTRYYLPVQTTLIPTQTDSN